MTPRLNEAQQALAADNLALAGWWLARNLWAVRQLGWDEALSVAYLGIVEAALRYDPDKHATFSTFACATIRGLVLTACNKVSYPRSVAACSCESALADAIAPGCDDRNEPDRELLSKQAGAALALLPRPEARVLRLFYLKGIPYAEIGRRMGITTCRAKRLRDRAIQLLRRAQREKEVSHFSAWHACQ
jgi:RNA polymerase sigma factor (sigma-70 family)